MSDLGEDVDNLRFALGVERRTSETEHVLVMSQNFNS
jgi:hypothetical protein